MVHFPSLQTKELEQMFPQPPQLFTSPARSTHDDPQVVDGAQGSAQAPCEQAVAPVQAVPQAPQFASSFARSTQRPLQSLRSLSQLKRESGLHTPAEQSWSVGQAVAHAPQFRTSLVRSTQLPLQEVCPLVQLEVWVVDAGPHPLSANSPIPSTPQKLM